MARGLRGVRDDLSELGRQLLDIACFLHPLLSPSHTDSPPPTPSLRPRRRSPSPLPSTPPSPRLIAGILADLAEIGGALRGGLSRFSVSLMTPIETQSPVDSAALLPPLPVRNTVGVSEEVVEFVRGLVKCPESWIQFAFPLGDDFAMSYVQRDHVAAIERLAPDLVDLRVSLCPTYMSEASFWKVYFALLHPKLSDHDAELLSTQQIVDSMRAAPRESEIRPASSDSSEKESSLITRNREERIHREDSIQSSIIRSFAKTRSDQSIDQWIFTKSRSQQSMDQWSEIPSDIDTNNNNNNNNFSNKEGSSRRRAASTEDLSSSDVDAASNILLLDKYMDSLISDGNSDNNVHSVSTSVRRENVRRKHASSDWSAVEEDSEFEMVDNL